MSVIITAYDQGGNGRVIDLYDGDTVSLVYNFTDLQKLTGKSNYTRDFRVPATANNSALFGHQYEATLISTNSVNTNIRRKFKAHISIDGIPIIDGYIQFRAAFITNNTVADYSLVFFGETIDLLADVKDRFISELVIDEEQQTRVKVIPSSIDAVNVGAVDPSTGYDYSDNRLKFALIDKGQKISHTGARLVDNLPLERTDLTPAFSLLFLLQLINEQFLTTQKLELSNSIAQHLSTIYLPYANDVNKGKFILENPVTANFYALHSPGVPTTTAITSWTPQSINGQTQYVATLPSFTVNVDDASGLSGSGRVYTFPFNAQGLITGGLQLQSDGPVNTGLRLYFKVTTGASTFYFSPLGAYDPVTFKTTDPVSGWQVYNPIFDPATPNSIAAPIIDKCTATASANTWQFYETDTVELLLVAQYDVYAAGTTVYLSNIDNGTNYGQTSGWTITNLANTATDQYIQFSKMAPEYLITDLINDILKAHNGILLPDRTSPNKVKMYTMAEYLAAGSLDDWTDLIDITSDITLTPTTEYQTKRQYFTYTDGNDYLNEVYRNGAYRTYGRLDLFDSSSDFTAGETKIELKARPTPNNTLLNALYNDNRNVPKFVDASYNYKAPGPRWLYWQGNIALGNVPHGALLGNYSDNTPGINSLDLNFGQEVPLHNYNEQPVNTLYLRYYNDYLAEVYSPESKILEASFMLGVKEVYNLEFNTSIFLFNTYWRILEVNDYVLGANKTCRVKLIRKLSSVDLPDLCNLTATAITTDGRVIWLDMDGNPASGTEACCNKIGYNWYGVSGCYRTAPGDTRPNANPGATGGDPIKDPTATTTSTTAISSGNVFIKDPGTTKDVVAVGDSVSFLGSNKNDIAIGSNLVLKEGVTDSAVFGTGAVIENRGLWFGTGDGAIPNKALYGVMVDAVDGNITAALTGLSSPIFKVNSNSYYQVSIKITAVQVVASAIVNSFTHTGVGDIAVDASGTCTFSDPDNTIYELATAGVWQVGLSMAGANEMQVYLQSLSGLTYPSNDWRVTFTTELTQVAI